jgi:hypothetical protein
MATKSFYCDEVFVPTGGEPGDMLAVVVQSGGKTGFVRVPDGMVEGACFEARIPYWIGDGWEAPTIKNVTLIKSVQALTEPEFFHGFRGVRSKPGKSLEAWPLVVVRAPAPREDDSFFFGVKTRWSEFDVRAHARPRP